MSRVAPLLCGGADDSGVRGRRGVSGCGDDAVDDAVDDALGKGSLQGATIKGARGEELRVTFVESNVARVTFCPDGKRRVQQSWMIDPKHAHSGSGGDGSAAPTTPTAASDAVRQGFVDEDHPGAHCVHVRGAPRDALFAHSSAGSAAETMVSSTSDAARGGPASFAMESGPVRVSGKASAGEPPVLSWHFCGQLIARDLSSMSYTYDKGGPRGHGAVAHYMERRSASEEGYFGLGEAAGAINRYGMRMRLDAIDAMGYTCEPGQHTSDPLYKHCPILFVNVRAPPTPVKDKDPKRQSDEEAAEGDEANDAEVQQGSVADDMAPRKLHEQTASTASLAGRSIRSEGKGALRPSLGWYALVYDNSSRGVMDLGTEISAFRGAYRYAQFEDGDLEYYMVFGQTLKSVVADVSRLVGRPLMPPRWCLGYLGSTMAYTEAPDAQQQLRQFVDLCHKHDILCDGFHLSSGYTCVDGRDGAFGPRCVFHWNKRRVPHPEQMFEHFNKADMRVLPNIKPWLLADAHPEYDAATSAGVCVQDPDAPDKPYVGLFWSGGAGTFSRGSYIDFSSKAGFRWWAERCRTRLIQRGARALWNDNNEYEVDDGMLLCGSGLTMSLMRPIQGLLMAMSSMGALLAERPNERPVVVTRSGSPGMQRYCTQTWSGDNTTSWATLQWNTPMGLSLGLCGVPGNGHDVGAFAGPMPSRELLVRWVQACMFMPRFSIHSWNSDATCTEPWSYTDAVDTVRGCIRQRYLFHPHMYNLHYTAHSRGLPVTRPLVLEFPNDPVCWGAAADAVEGPEKDDVYVRHAASCDFLLGAGILVCPIYTPDTTSRIVYLPTEEDTCTFWFSPAREEWLPGGATLMADCPLSSTRPIMFVRNATLVTTLQRPPKRSTEEVTRGSCGRVFTLYVGPRDTRMHATHMEDDGISIAGTQFLFDFDVEADTNGVACRLSLTKRTTRYLPTTTEPASFTLPFTHVTVRLSPRDGRKLVVTTSAQTYEFRDGRGQVPLQGIIAEAQEK